MGPYADRQDSLSEADVHIQMLGTHRVDATALSEHQTARCPAQEGQLHGMSVP